MNDLAFLDFVDQLDQELRATADGTIRLEQTANSATWSSRSACAGVERADLGVLAWLGTDDGSVVSAFPEPRSADAAHRLALGFAAALSGPGEI